MGERHQTRRQESIRLSRKYTNADMPNEIEIMTHAMRTVRDTLPNYAYVSDFRKDF